MRSGPDQRSGSRFSRNRPAPPSRAPSYTAARDGHGPGDRVGGSASQMRERYLETALKFAPEKVPPVAR